MRDQRGTAMVEGVVLGVVLIVPVIWLLGVLADLHRVALAATAAAREAGSAAAQVEDRPAANAVVEAAVATAFQNHGADPRRARVDWGGSVERGGRVEVVISYPVSVLQAPFLGRAAGPAVWVRASHATLVDRYRSE